MFNVHRIIAECHLGFLLGCIKAAYKLFRSLCHTHAFSAAAKRRFYNDRIADLICDLCALFSVIDWIFTSRNDRNTGVYHRIPCLGFISQTLNNLGFRPDKCNVALFAQLCEPAVLREESESRMNGVRPGDHRGADDILHIQVTLRRGGRPDTYRLIGKLCMQRVAVCLRVYGDCLNPHLTARADDTHSDLTAVCDQYFSNHLLFTPLP